MFLQKLCLQKQRTGEHSTDKQKTRSGNQKESSKASNKTSSQTKEKQDHQELSARKPSRKHCHISFQKQNKSAFQEFTDKKEFEKRKKSMIESSALFKGIHGEVITELEEECNRFISETSHTKQADLKIYGSQDQHDK